MPGTCSVLKHEFQPGPNSLCRGLRSEKEGVSHTRGGMSVHTYHVVVARDVFGPVSVEHNSRLSPFMTSHHIIGTEWGKVHSCTSLASLPEHYKPCSQATTTIIRMETVYGVHQSSLTSVSASPLEAPSLPFPLPSPPPSQTGWSLTRSLCRITKPHTRNQHLTTASNRHEIQPIRELPIQEK